MNKESTVVASSTFRRATQGPRSSVSICTELLLVPRAIITWHVRLRRLQAHPKVHVGLPGEPGVTSSSHAAHASRT